MLHERTRAIIHTRDFLMELSAHTELPRELRSRAESTCCDTIRAQLRFVWLEKAKSCMLA